MSRGSADSTRATPATLLGPDGGIDLTGGLGRRSAEAASPGVGSADAWLVDRQRRSMLPPFAPTTACEAELPPQTIPPDISEEIADRFALGDYAGALRAAELRLGLDPTDQSARHYATESRRRLEARYTTRIGSLDHVFNVAVPPAKVRWLGLDPQAAFLLSLVDGQTTVHEILAVCAMGRLEALRVFAELLDAKAIVRVA
ncbi:MAG: hypothetical protein WAU39_16015 [Polyangiales bacterium]